MTLTCTWVKDETGALMMSWADGDSAVPVMTPGPRELTRLAVVFAEDDGQAGAAAAARSSPLSRAASLCRVRGEPASPGQSRCP